MGRQNWKERPKKGPGKKSKKQGDPDLPPRLKEEDKKVRRMKSSGVLGGRIKQRSRKREMKLALEKAVNEEVVKKKRLSKRPETKKIKSGKIRKTKDMKAKGKLKKTILKEDSNGSSGGKYYLVAILVK